MIDNDAFNGALRKNPLNFQDYKMTLRGLFRPEGGEYTTVFQSLLTDIAGGCYDHGNAISREDFPNGYIP